MKAQRVVIGVLAGLLAASGTLMVTGSALSHARARAIAEGPLDYLDVTYQIPASQTTATGGGAAKAGGHQPAAVPRNSANAITDEPVSLLGPDSDARLRVTAYGDVANADKVSVFVPGVGQTARKFDEFAAAPELDNPNHVSDQALVLYRKMLAQDPTAKVAVVAWLGYTPPSKPFGAVNAEAAQIGAASLNSFSKALNKANPGAGVSWICHSYGTLVCGSALGGATSPDNLVLLASPGIHVDSVTDLHTTAKVFAARGNLDVVGLTQGLNLFGAGFGPDPASPAFGAIEVPTDVTTDHFSYFRAGSRQLGSLAAIGRTGNLAAA